MTLQDFHLCSSHRMAELDQRKSQEYQIYEYLSYDFSIEEVKQALIYLDVPGQFFNCVPKMTCNYSETTLLLSGFETILRSNHGSFRKSSPKMVKSWIHKYNHVNRYRKHFVESSLVGIKAYQRVDLSH